MLTLKDTQKCPLSIQPVDAKGNAAPVDGAPQWSSSDANVASVVPAADGLTADVVAGQPGTATISVTCDADLGTGVTSIAGTLDVTVLAGQAVSVNITTGTPVDQ